MSLSGFGDIVSVLAFHDSIFQCAAASLLTFSAISCFVVAVAAVVVVATVVAAVVAFVAFIKLIQT